MPTRREQNQDTVLEFNPELGIQHQLPKSDRLLLSDEREATVEDPLALAST